MKIRSGFVSNSSSSSFIIPLYKLSEEQKEKIYNHIEVGKQIDDKLLADGKDYRYEYYEEWKVLEDDFCIWCSTSMDNFDLIGLVIEELKLDYDDIIHIGEGTWGDSVFELDEYRKLKNDMLRGKKIKKVKGKLDEQ